VSILDLVTKNSSRVEQGIQGINEKVQSIEGVLKKQSQVIVTMETAMQEMSVKVSNIPSTSISQLDVPTPSISSAKPVDPQDAAYMNTLRAYYQKSYTSLSLTYLTEELMVDIWAKESGLRIPAFLARFPRVDLTEELKQFVSGSKPQGADAIRKAEAVLASDTLSAEGVLLQLKRLQGQAPLNSYKASLQNHQL
jgi:hypothetical protein